MTAERGERDEQIRLRTVEREEKYNDQVRIQF